MFLAGAGFTAHVFDGFAPKFNAAHHVYGITRRGFGASSAPPPTDYSNYTADGLADDVLAVLDKLALTRPALAGHSIAGEEMSFIGSRHLEKVSGLIYLDAAFSYAFYSFAKGDLIIDAIDLHKLLTGYLLHGFNDEKELHQMEVAATRLQKDSFALGKQWALMPARPPKPAAATPPEPIALALSKGRRKYTEIHAPVLAIFADPHNFCSLYADNPVAKFAVIENDRETTSAQADAFQAGVPSARVVRIADADHFIFQSSESEVMKEMNDFLRKLQ